MREYFVCALTRHRERAMMNIIVFTQLFIYTQKPLTHNTIYCFFVYKWLLCVVYMRLNIHWVDADLCFLGYTSSSSSWLVIPRCMYIFLMFINIIFHPLPSWHVSHSFPAIILHFLQLRKLLFIFLFDHGGVKLLICNETWTSQ